MANQRIFFLTRLGIQQLDSHAEFRVEHHTARLILRIKLLAHAGQNNDGKFQAFALMNGHQANGRFLFGDSFGFSVVDVIFYQAINITNKMIQPVIACGLIGNGFF